MIYYFFIENKKKVTWFLDFSLYKKNSYMKLKKRYKKDQNRYKNFTIGKKSYYITLILGRLKFLGWYSKDRKTFIFAKKNH